MKSRELSFPAFFDVSYTIYGRQKQGEGFVISLNFIGATFEYNSYINKKSYIGRRL